MNQRLTLPTALLLTLPPLLWAGNAVIAHDNPFNRHTAGDGQFYFTDGDSCAAAIERVIADDDAVAAAGAAARVRAESFRWDDVLAAYEGELRRVGGYPALAASPIRIDASPARAPVGTDM